MVSIFSETSSTSGEAFMSMQTGKDIKKHLLFQDLKGTLDFSFDEDLIHRANLQDTRSLLHGHILDYAMVSIIS